MCYFHVPDFCSHWVGGWGPHKHAVLSSSLLLATLAASSVTAAVDQACATKEAKLPHEQPVHDMDTAADVKEHAVAARLDTDANMPTDRQPVASLPAASILAFGQKGILSLTALPLCVDPAGRRRTRACLTLRAPLLRPRAAAQRQ
ncbi:hypothetical protein PHYSODRAFT_306662 [Phytophthora sojae]|uniref:RxLR effector protein n=1 Tax=Phytophthora sojae (strain P6497) TaxID=1094619 RepID=G5AA65_PHYSP|nr:hypothetical protein PHYSODRAFT_306662 [Phytophthora sojae]EGZ07494.1 hypothetical protein PHYSODRAFT_306662 [Phytophthora sojae]|eukprot:XP_009537060.1 hypothetical protein PHYSODRAFT_306662 [Phytophthora sojae]